MAPPYALLKRADAAAPERTRIVYPWELPSIMRKHILTGAMGTTYFALFSGIYMVYFGNAIGLRYWHWGLLSAGSSFVLGFQLLSAYLVARTGNRKLLWYAAALAGRLLRGAAVGVAFALSARAPGAARAALIAILLAANCLEAIAAPPWLSWLADIIPHDEHGRFMGRRAAWLALANICVVIPIGFGIDRVPEGWKLSAVMAVFAFAFAAGVLDLLVHRTIPEPPMEMPPRREFWHEVAAPLRDRAFRPWLVFNAVWTFGMTLGGALATVYFVEDLGIKRNFFGGSIALIVLPLLGTVLAGRRLGGMVDTHGVRRTLLWGHRFWALLPLFWLLARPSTALLWLGFSALIGGLAGTTALTAANKLITRLPPPGHVPMYVAVSACIGSLAGGLGPLAGSAVLHAAQGLDWTVGPYAVAGFHILFAASLLLRNASIGLIRHIQEPAPPAGPASGEAVPAGQPGRADANVVAGDDKLVGQGRPEDAEPEPPPR